MGDFKPIVTHSAAFCNPFLKNNIKTEESRSIANGLLEYICVDIIDLAFIAFENRPDLDLKIKVESAVLGKKLKTTNDKVVYETLAVAKEVGLADCIEKIYIEDCTNGYDLWFETRTGVIIRVVDVMQDGAKKALTAFSVYDTIASDYQKRFGSIASYYVENKLQVQYIFDDVDKDVLLFSEDI